jgi:hypothetical protein
MRIIRLRVDADGGHRNVGHGARGTYYLDNEPVWNGEPTREVPLTLLEQEFNEIAKRPVSKLVKLDKTYTAVIAPDKKTVRVGCTTFDAARILEVAEALK